ncbi:MAG: SUMF1/EgtB/PvdO family nonheme iron enzyme, partial [bacterium]|nr:SUMF1/EgtB/PvdO family nonheme iron enzyme [bacterium]
KQGGLLLLDGLDEVPKADRRRVQIKQAVEQFRDLFPRCRILVTSRTYAYQQQDWRLQDFRGAVLAPFNKAQIDFFVEHWYQHMATMRGMDCENAQGRAEVLKRAIERSERLQDFARRPLLLTLMASLHAWRGGSLPEKRGELYAEATDLLLDWWERNKVVRDAEGRIRIDQPSLSEMLRVGKDQVRQVLHRLAFEAHQGQTDTSGTADVPEERLSVELMRICRNERLNPLLLMEHLSDRAGLLVPRGVGVYSFPHRSFQEYLTACHLVEQDDYPDNIADLARQEPNRWREVLLLAAAKASDIAPMIWVLAEALCYQASDESAVTAQDAWGALLAGQALMESANLESIGPRNRPKVRRIQDWLVAILTEQQPKDKAFPVVERALAGNLLAVLGDPRPGVRLRKDGLPDIEWCEVPAGEFLMGDTAFSNAPPHRVTVSGFHISRYSITNAQYQRFIDDGGYTCKEYWTKDGWEGAQRGPEKRGGDFDLANHPVVAISWYDTQAFCQWLTLRFRESGELREDWEIRLPTEAEWEKAARGTDSRIFPWGNEEMSPELGNY